MEVPGFNTHAKKIIQKSAPVLLRRVIELEKRIAWLEKVCRMAGVPEAVIEWSGLETPTPKDIEIALALIAQAQEGGER